ncbi:MAG: nitrate reductase cytochrome c-type subunit [Campylobacterales bacterium]
MSTKVVLTAILGSALCLLAAPIAEESLGLAKVGVEADTALSDKPFRYQGQAPGSGNKRIKRTYANQPPMIPHDISSLPVITQTENVCIGCHMPDVAKAMGAIPVPKSHMINLRTKTDLKGQLHQGRWNCTQCHAPQAELDPVVMNKFRGAFAKRMGTPYKSRLAETLYDGVVEDRNGSFDLNSELAPEDR